MRNQLLLWRLLTAARCDRKMHVSLFVGVAPAVVVASLASLASLEERDKPVVAAASVTSIASVRVAPVVAVASLEESDTPVVAGASVSDETV